MDKLVELATKSKGVAELLDESMDILSHSNGEPHNTITPMQDSVMETLSLIYARNNRTSDAYPLGIFHPHAEHHHLKKENIGLIEVMGCAILPARLKDELAILQEGLLGNLDLTREPSVEKHLHWVKEIQEKYPNITSDNVERIVKQEVGVKFVGILEQCGVFPQTKNQAFNNSATFQ